MHRHERQVMLALLTLSAILGTVFAFLTPIWADVEEPAHFEIVRFIADHHRLPQPGEADPVTQQRIIESYVWAHHRWGIGGPMLNARVTEAWNIDEPADWQRVRDELSLRGGYEDLSTRTQTSTDQTGEAPGYYLIAAMPQFLLSGPSIETQLMAARMVSVLLGVLAVWLAWLAAREAFPHRWTLRIAAPALVALLPSFVVLQSSVNNTIAAVTAVALAVYAAARFVRRGYSAVNLLLVVGASAACMLSKTTAFAAVPMLLAALPMARRTAWSRWVWAAGGVGIVALLALTFSWQRPASWYPASDRAVRSEDAPSGDWVMRFTPDASPQTLWQTLPAATVQQLRGETVTLGTWMQAVGEPFEAVLPGLWAAPNEGVPAPLTPQSPGQAALTPMWSFHAVTFTVPAETQCMAVRLSLEGDATSASARAYDGLVLAQGARPLDEPPIFDDAAGTSGQWGGEPFDNLLRNGSAERGQPLPRPGIIPESVPVADMSVSISMHLATFFDARANASALSQSLRWLFTSFWARFGWTNPGLPVWIVAGLAVLTGISLVGLVRYTLKRRRTMPLWQRRSLGLVALVAAAVVGAAVFRLDPMRLPLYCDFYQGRFLSTGYYIVPGVLPLMLLWYLGLEAWLPERWHRWLLAAVVLLFFTLTMGMLLGRMLPAFLDAYGVETPVTLVMHLWSGAP